VLLPSLAGRTSLGLKVAERYAAATGGMLGLQIGSSAVLKERCHVLSRREAN
jgi:hypothetical protein